MRIGPQIRAARLIMLHSTQFLNIIRTVRICNRNERTESYQHCGDHIHGVNTLLQTSSSNLPMAVTHRYALGFSLEKIAAMQEHGIKGLSSIWYNEGTHVDSIRCQYISRAPGMVLIWH